MSLNASGVPVGDSVIVGLPFASSMPATGTPVQGGLEWYYTLELLREVFKEKKVVGADIVEVAPRPGDVVTEYGAAQLCYTMIGFLSALEKPPQAHGVI